MFSSSTPIWKKVAPNFSSPVLTVPELVAAQDYTEQPDHFPQEIEAIRKIMSYPIPVNYYPITLVLHVAAGNANLQLSWDTSCNQAFNSFETLVSIACWSHLTYIITL